MTNRDFLVLYTKPITSIFLDEEKTFDDDAQNIRQEISDFLKQNNSLPNKEFRSKVIEKYGNEVSVMRPIYEGNKLSKIKQYIKVLYIIVIASVILSALFALTIIK